MSRLEQAAERLRNLSDEEREERRARHLEDAAPTVQCPERGCKGRVESIERYHVSVGWERTQRGWELGAHDNGTHFHLFCSEGHEAKRWGRELPPTLQRVVFPAEG